MWLSVSPSRSACYIFGRMMRWLIALPFLLLFASRLEAQRSYTLDDWMTIASVSSFAWSPDAATIYYAGDDAGSGTTEIFRVASNGGEPTRLTNNDSGTRPEPKQQMTMSPDGEWIYYASLLTLRAPGSQVQERCCDDPSLG